MSKKVAKKRSKDKDIKKEGKGVSGYDVEDEKNFYKIDGTSQPSQDEEGDISYSQDGHGGSRRDSFLFGKERKKRAKSFATDDEDDKKKRKTLGKGSAKKVKPEAPKKSKSEDDKLSTDTDGHMCDKCYVDRVLFKHQNEEEDGTDSNDSLSSWDSECARIYAEVASKEVYDPNKIFKILHTKQYQAEKFLEEQKKQEEVRVREQEKLLEDLKKSQRGKKVTLSVKDDASTGKQVSYRQNLSRQKSEDKKSEKASSIKNKKVQSMRDMLSMQLNRLDPNIPQIQNPPSMSAGPKDKFKIMMLVEEMIKQNNKIYKAELMKIKQEEEDKKQDMRERRQNLKDRLEYILSKNREAFLKKQEENRDKQKGPLHEYGWWRDQTKLDQVQEIQEDKTKDYELRRKKRQEDDIDKFFSEYIDKVQKKILARRKRLRRSASARGHSAAKLFKGKSKKEIENEFQINSRKKKLEAEQSLKEEEEKAKLENIHLLKIEQEEKIKAEKELEQRRKKFASNNQKSELDIQENEAQRRERGKNAQIFLEKQKQEQKLKSKKKKDALKKIQEKALLQLKKSKKKDFSTLSSMDFEFSDILGKPEDEVVKKPLSKKEQELERAKEQEKAERKKKFESKNAKDSNKKDHTLKRITDGKQKVSSSGKGEKNPIKGLSKQRQQMQDFDKDYENEQDEVLSQEIHDEERKDNQFDIPFSEEIEVDFEKLKKDNEIQVAKIISSTSLKTIRPKGLAPQDQTASGEKTKKQKQREEKMMEMVVEEESIASTKKQGFGLLPDDFIEKIFQTAEMQDLPKEFLQAIERKEDSEDFRPRPSAFKVFEREIQGELYRKNEKPISAHLKKQFGGTGNSLQSKLITQSSVMKDRARNNNFLNQSRNVTQHLLQGEIDYKDTKWKGVKQIAAIPPKPHTISEETRSRNQKEKLKVSVIEPELPPLEQRRREQKNKSIKSQYEKEYKEIEKEEKEIMDEKIRKQQNYIFNHDIEDNIFEMANKEAFEAYDQKKATKQKNALQSIGQTLEKEDVQLYADPDGTEAYQAALKDLVPEVFKNISKSNFASMIKKQKGGGDEENEES